jgi:hypothetical protein
LYIEGLETTSILVVGYDSIGDEMFRHVVEVMRFVGGWDAVTDCQSFQTQLRSSPDQMAHNLFALLS